MSTRIAFLLALSLLSTIAACGGEAPAAQNVRQAIEEAPPHLAPFFSPTESSFDPWSADPGSIAAASHAAWKTSRLTRDGRMEEADSLGVGALESSPRLALLMHNVAVNHLAMGKFEPAVHLAREAVLASRLPSSFLNDPASDAAYHQGRYHDQLDLMLLSASVLENDLVGAPTELPAAAKVTKHLESSDVHERAIGLIMAIRTESEGGGNNEIVSEMLQGLRELDSDHPVPLLAAAFWGIYLDLEQAHKDAEGALQLEPEWSPLGSSLLGLIRMRQGEFELAIPHLERALAIYSVLEEAATGVVPEQRQVTERELAQALGHLGETERAAEVFAESALADKKIWTSLDGREGLPLAEFIATVSKRLEEDEQRVLDRYFLAWALQANKEFDEARRHFENLEDHPALGPLALFGLGCVASGAGDREEAQQRFLAAYERESSFYLAGVERVHALAAEGDSEGTLKTCLELIELRPDRYWPWAVAARAAFSLGEHSTVVRAATAATEIVELSCFNQLNERYEDTSSENLFSELLYWRGMSCLELGLREQAEFDLREAVGRLGVSSEKGKRAWNQLNAFGALEVCSGCQGAGGFSQDRTGYTSCTTCLGKGRLPSGSLCFTCSGTRQMQQTTPESWPCERCSGRGWNWLR